MKNVILIGTEEDIIFELRRAGYLIKGYFGKQKKTLFKIFRSSKQNRKLHKKDSKKKNLYCYGSCEEKKKIIEKV